MTVTAYDVDRALNNARPIPSEDYLNGWKALHYGETRSVYTALGVFEYVKEKRFAGDPYEGSPLFVVVKLGDRYFQKEGTYSSWDGSSIDGECVEVEPVEVPLTFYRHKE